MVGRDRTEFLNRMNALLESKTAVIVAMHQFSYTLTEFINWAVPEGNLQTDVTPLLRENYLEL